MIQGGKGVGDSLEYLKYQTDYLPMQRTIYLWVLRKGSNFEIHSLGTVCRFLNTLSLK